MTELPTSTAAHDVWMRFFARELAGEDVDFEAACAARPDIADELRRLRAQWSQSNAPAEPSAARRAPVPLESWLSRLAAAEPRAARYRIEGELARGGMGVVHRVWDADLNRHLALKTLRTPNVGRAALARFVEEAQIAAQLDHPAIVPVHDVGVDDLGRPFFVMKLVDGRDLRHVFEQAWKGEQGWSTTRVLGVLLKVCEAAGYAHKKGVIHRDLKPSNVMVGRFGEVYVMDWGVARVLGESVRRDSGVRAVATVRTGTSREDTDSALLTAAGDVVGTAAYMSPEQARGEIERLTPQSDVYAVGAMLYHLIARRAPYASDGASSAEVLARVRIGPPPPIADLEPAVAPELAAICAKAMEREPGRRYGDLAELADDLRAYLEGRVVRAHGTGRWVTAKKWVRRNRALSASVASALVLLAAGAWIQHRSSVVHANFELLARLRQPTELLTEYELLWPATSRNLPTLERWLADAEEVARHIDEYRSMLESLRASAEPWNQGSANEQIAERELEIKRQRARRLIEYLESEREELRRTGAEKNYDGMTMEEIEAQIERDRPTLLAREAMRVERQTWTFASADDQLLHDRLTALIPDIERLMDAPDGYSRIERVRRAIEVARAQGDASLVAQRGARWEAALASIGDPRECPQYGGLVLSPQAGLLPIGRDPRSGLWEFAHLQSGEPAQRRADGVLELREETGIVLVLLPAARCVQGSQDDSPDAPYFDPDHQDIEAPQVALIIDPFFLSKYEMTQAQWQRWTGHDPSNHTIEVDPEIWFSRLQPVESLNWFRAVEVLRELGLALPFEAQWEFAARGGTDAPWSNPGGVAELARYANLLDPARREYANEPDLELDPRMGRDGFAGSAPVGSLEPNPFGLHDVHGNVAEWCADLGDVWYKQPRWLGTGARSVQGVDQGGRVCRGGHLRSTPREARSAARFFAGPNYASPFLGLRPARAIEP